MGLPGQFSVTINTLVLQRGLSGRESRQGAYRSLAYDIHSWRYNAACELVEAGCGDDLVASVTGQSPAMVLHYTKKVRQKIRAIQAQQKRSDRSRNPAP